MRKIIFVISLLGLLFVVSCNNKQDSSNAFKSAKIDTVWNEKVQDTFYGLRLGDYVDVNTVVSTLENQGFMFARNESSDDLLHFVYSKSLFYSFGGLNWAILDVQLNNGIFAGIRFMNASNDKASSLTMYGQVKTAIEKKYSPTFVSPKDTSVYSRTFYFGRNNIRAAACCDRYESIEKKIMIGIQLEYICLKCLDVPSDDL